MRLSFVVVLGIFFVSCVQGNTQGGWAAWSEWSGWAKGLCSGNQRVKTRACTNPLPATNGEYCPGDNAVQQNGQIDGGLSEWTQWSSCEKPCGGSTVNRTRFCDNPPPQNGGAHCKGSTFETKLECVMECPEGRTDGGWSPWSLWSNCPKLCTRSGGHIVKRYRQCNMPPPMYGGSACLGNDTDEMISCFNNCPVNGGFGSWSSFTKCSKTCGSGVMVRQRSCNNPEPRGNNAKNCTGAFTETKHCRLATCIGAINGDWTSWGSWSTCLEERICFKGIERRTRTCTNPAPNKGGDDCVGIKEQGQVCPTQNCIDTRPTPPPTLPVEKTDYLSRECGATVKRIAIGAIPQGVLNHLKLHVKKFTGGYYAKREEEKGVIEKYCFDTYPPLTIKEAADMVPSYRKTDGIPNYKSPSETFPVLGFSIRVFKGTNKLKGWEFGIEKSDEYIPGNGLTLNEVMFTYYSEGKDRSFLAKGKYRLFSPTVFDCVVFRNITDLLSKGNMLGNAASFKLKGILTALNVPDSVGGYGGGVLKAIKNLGIWEFEFAPVSIGYDFQHAMKSPFRITATATFGGVPLHFEMIYIHHGWDRKVAFGFTFDGESFGAVVEKMSGSGSIGKAVAGFLNTIGLQVEVGLSWCPSYFGKFLVTKNTRFFKQPLKDLYKYEIPEGLTAVAQVSIPKDCKGSTFCDVTKAVIGPKAKFRVAGLVKAGYYKITGGFYKVRIYREYYFQKLELYAEVNTTSRKRQVGFKAEIKLPINQGDVIVDGIAEERSIRLGGSLKHTIGKTDLTGSLHMRGMWYHSFGLSWLNIGNIYVAISIDAKSPVVFSGFQLGGQLEFGTNCIYDADFNNDGHCLRIRIYFGVGLTTYFYGKISALTIGKLVRMCGGGSSLPKPVARAGFPQGLKVSYNPSDKDVDLRSAGGPYVHKGFRLKGTLDLFGYQIKAEIKYSSREILIDAELDPIRVLKDALVMSRNASHRNVGPKLFFHYKTAPPGSLITLPYFKMYFEGYVKVLGIEASAYINITMQAMEIYVYGKVWNLIYAELYISAGYDYLNIADAHFYIRVIVDLRGLTDAIKKAQQAVDKAFKAAQKTLNDAIDKVKDAKRKCKETLKLKCSNCYSLKCKQAEQNCKGFLNKVGKWIGGVINKAGRWIKNTVRKIGDGLAKVGRKIKKFFSGWRRRRALIGQRDEHFDIHIRNRRFISKLICEGLVGGGCKGISHLCYGSCKVVDYIGQGLCNIVDVAVFALRAAEKVCGWINTAIKFLLEIFLVHGIRFELGLGQRFNGFMIAAEIDLTIFGKRMYFGFYFDLKNPFRSIMSAKDGSLYKYKKGVRQLRTALTYNPYDRPNPFADFDLTGTFGIESLQTSSENRLGSCVTALTQGVNAQLVLVGCNATDERQRWTYTLKGSLINLYSKKCLMMSNSVGGNLYQGVCEKSKNLQTHECDVVTRTLKLRRNDLCVTGAKSSPNGPGSLVHLGSLKCIRLSAGNRLILRTGCNRADNEFEIDSKTGHLIYKTRNLCARPVNGQATSGAKIELVQRNSGCHKFGFTKLGSLQHLQSRLCFQTPKKEMKPVDYTELILGTRCEFIKNRASGSLPDAQMTFTFVPQNNKLTMQPCANFYEGRLEQRFSVMNEELNSVCSKFAHDIALNKIASQSSIKHNGFPSRAVDGNYNFQWQKGSCTHTNEETDPWWRVDLGKEYIVTDVTILNRGDHGERLKNIQVHIGNKLTVRRNPVCHDRIRQAHDGEAVRVQCDPPIPGQFVGIQMYGKGILTMCEVIVASRLGGFADWCQIENGGCEQLCYNQCGRKTTCGCLPGYKLAYNGKTCIDVDECRSNNGGCRVDKQAFCLNFPGSFYCGCNKGYILKDDSLKECVDINECGMRNGGCEQMCNNTLGGYLCNCRQGYERRPNDLYGCQDINECKTNNGGCDHTCYNYDGGRFCRCKAAFRLKEDRTTCEELYCPILEAPYLGLVSPATCVTKYHNIPVGSVCKFQCAKGHEITDKVNQTDLACNIDGNWNRESPACLPVKCPLLPRPANGGIVPARCHSNGGGFSEFGQRCVGYCKHGYRLRGPATKYCQDDKTWSNNASPVECIKIIEPLYLNCPNDIIYALAADKSSAVLGTLWQEPQTNINRTKIQSYPKNVGPNHAFTLGRHIVSYLAEYETGQMLSCSFSVDIKDETPPKMTGCPKDISQTSSNYRQVVTWTEPTFTDNVAIRSVIKAERKPREVWTSGQSMKLQYVAMDTSGNQVICSFTVSFKSINCPALLSTDTTKSTVLFPLQKYTLTCKSRMHVMFGHNIEGSVAVCKGGDYVMESKNIGLTVPECVAYVNAKKDTVCKPGSVKMSYLDFWDDRYYYCANCPLGTFFNSSSTGCSKCNVGFYQDEQGQTSCERCQIGTTTEKSGSKYSNDCREYCLVGHYSATGFYEQNSPCKPCPMGTYSFINGSKTCTACPNNANTNTTGSTSPADCLEPPRIMHLGGPNGEINVKFSNAIVVECFFNGLPLPKVTWSKANGLIPSSADIDPLHDLNMHTIGSMLTLYKVSMKEGGVYKCHVENKNGSDEKTVRLNVKV